MEIEEIRAPDTRPAYEESQFVITRLDFVNVDRLCSRPHGGSVPASRSHQGARLDDAGLRPTGLLLHEIVHNQFVVDYFKSLASCSSTTSRWCARGPVMLSAHGSPPEVIEAARQSGGTVIDAVCPLVTKVTTS